MGIKNPPRFIRIQYCHVEMLMATLTCFASIVKVHWKHKSFVLPFNVNGLKHVATWLMSLSVCTACFSCQTQKKLLDFIFISSGRVSTSHFDKQWLEQKMSQNTTENLMHSLYRHAFTMLAIYAVPWNFIWHTSIINMQLLFSAAVPAFCSRVYF